jgi:hypothetical protein
MSRSGSGSTGAGPSAGSALSGKAQGYVMPTDQAAAELNVA